MKKITIIVVILLILLIMFVILLSYVAICTPKYKESVMYKYDDIKQRLKTGDILLFSCNNNISTIWKMVYKFRENLVGSKFGHAGLIIKCRNGKLYVLECCNYDHCAAELSHHFNNYNKGGARMVELDTLLKVYNSEYGGSFGVKFISKAIPNSLIAKHLKKYKKTIFQNLGVVIITALLDILVSNKLALKFVQNYDPNKMTCTEFMYNILRDCNILKDYPAKTFWPHTIVNGTINEIENINYSNIYEFGID